MNAFKAARDAHDELARDFAERITHLYHTEGLDSLQGIVFRDYSVTTDALSLAFDLLGIADPPSPQVLEAPKPVRARQVYRSSRGKGKGRAR